MGGWKKHSKFPVKRLKVGEVGNPLGAEQEAVSLAIRFPARANSP